MKKILLIFLFIFISNTVMAEKIFYGEIQNTSQYNLEVVKQEAKIALQNMEQPADMFGFEYFSNRDVLILWGNKSILIEISKIKEAYQSGIIQLIGIREYNQFGYIRNRVFKDINSRIMELRKYDIGVSTP